MVVDLVLISLFLNARDQMPTRLSVKCKWCKSVGGKPFFFSLTNWNTKLKKTSRIEYPSISVKNGHKGSTKHHRCFMTRSVQAGIFLTNPNLSQQIKQQKKDQSNAEFLFCASVDSGVWEAYSKPLRSKMCFRLFWSYRNSWQKKISVILTLSKSKASEGNDEDFCSVWDGNKGINILFWSPKVSGEAQSIHTK